MRDDLVVALTEANDNEGRRAPARLSVEHLPVLAVLALGNPSLARCDREWLKRRRERGDWVPVDLVLVSELLSRGTRELIAAALRGNR